jgi:hypothetical protein
MGYYKHVDHKILGKISSQQMKPKGIIRGAISRPNKTIEEGNTKA